MAAPSISQHSPPNALPIRSFASTEATKVSAEQIRPVNEFLAENLRKTGVEVGVYDDGIVIRGMENIVNGSDFDGGEWPQVGLALTVHSLAIQNDEPVGHVEVVEQCFPGIVDKLKSVLVQENSEKEGA